VKVAPMVSEGSGGNCTSRGAAGGGGIDVVAGRRVGPGAAVSGTGVGWSMAAAGVTTLSGGSAGAGGLEVGAVIVLPAGVGVARDVRMLVSCTNA
jgi:hypothetical protein